MGEAAGAGLVLGVISSVIVIIDSSKKTYDAAKDKSSLPTAFPEVVQQLPLIQIVLIQVHEYIEKEILGKEEKTEIIEPVKPVVKLCEEKAMELKKMFEAVILVPGATRLRRYMKLVKIVGKGGRVEELAEALLKNVYLLADRCGRKAATSEQVQQLLDAIKKMSELERSVSDSILEERAFNIDNSGNGTQHNSIAMGGQQINNNPGSGKQYNSGLGGHQYFGTDG